MTKKIILLLKMQAFHLLACLLGQNPKYKFEFIPSFTIQAVRHLATFNSLHFLPPKAFTGTFAAPFCNALRFGFVRQSSAERIGVFGPRPFLIFAPSKRAFNYRDSI